MTFAYESVICNEGKKNAINISKILKSLEGTILQKLLMDIFSLKSFYLLYVHMAVISIVKLVTYYYNILYNY